MCKRVLALLILGAPMAALAGLVRTPSPNTATERELYVLCDGTDMAVANEGTACGSLQVVGYHREWKLEFHDPDGECSALSVAFQGRSCETLNTASGSQTCEWITYSTITTNDAPTVVEGSAFLPPFIRVMPTTVTDCVDPFILLDVGPEWNQNQD